MIVSLETEGLGSEGLGSVQSHSRYRTLVPSTSHFVVRTAHKVALRIYRLLARSFQSWRSSVRDKLGLL